jgi:hypothetical protein
MHKSFHRDNITSHSAILLFAAIAQCFFTSGILAAANDRVTGQGCPYELQRCESRCDFYGVSPRCKEICRRKWGVSGSCDCSRPGGSCTIKGARLFLSGLSTKVRLIGTTGAPDEVMKVMRPLVMHRTHR